MVGASCTMASHVTTKEVRPCLGLIGFPHEKSLTPAEGPLRDDLGFALG